MSHKTKSIVIGLCLVLAGSLNAQTKISSYLKTFAGRPTVDDRGLGTISCWSEGDVYYHAKSKNINFGEQTAYYGDPTDSFLTGMISNAAQIPFASAASLAASFLKSYATYFLQSLNVKNRGYIVYIPVAGNYKITTGYKGIWGINPSNYINVCGADGGMVFNHSCQLGSDTDWVYNIALNPGLYTFTIGVGEVSNMYVSAGSLKGVSLSHPSYLDWMERKKIASTNIAIIDFLPSIGNQAWIATDGSSFIDSSLMDGSIILINNYAHLINISGFQDTLIVNEYLTSSGMPVNGYTRESKQAMAAILQEILSTDGGTKRWLIQRLADADGYITVIGAQYPSPVYWNGEWIIVPEY